jgi:hypothetical protein
VELAVADGVCVGSGVKLAVADGVCVGVGLAVGDGVPVGTGDALAVADDVATIVDVSAGGGTARSICPTRGRPFIAKRMEAPMMTPMTSGSAVRDFIFVVGSGMDRRMHGIQARQPGRELPAL